MNRTIALFCVLAFHLLVSAFASQSRDWTLECRTRRRGAVRLRQMGDTKSARVDMHDLPGKQLQVIFIGRGMRSGRKMCTRLTLQDYRKRLDLIS